MDQHSHFTYLHREDFAYLLEYKQSLTNASESRLFDLKLIATVMGQHSHFTYLHRVDFAYLLEYKQSLTNASESQLFDSVVDHWSCT